MPRNLEPHSVAFHQRLRRGALVVLPLPQDTSTQALRFQYNPETVTRTRTGQFEHRKGAPPPQKKTTVDAQRRGGLHVESETVALKLVFDATEALLNGRPEGAQGVLPELAMLERMAMGREPSRDEEKADGALTSINPPELLLVLGERSFPVVIVSSTIVEQRFSPELVPLRAEVELRMRVLEVTENAANSKVAQAFEQLREQRERLAEQAAVTGTVEQIVQQALQPVERLPSE